MSQQLNYLDYEIGTQVHSPTVIFGSENVPSPHGSIITEPGNEHIRNLRFAFDPDRCLPPREGQIYPVLTPLFTV
jgi:hypothetical protein